MFMVYWMKRSVKSDRDNDNDHIEFDEMVEAQSQDFPHDQMSAALKFMEQLRNDDSCRFITMCSENPNSVGKPGIDEVGPDYNWTKRRGNMPGLKK